MVPMGFAELQVCSDLKSCSDSRKWPWFEDIACFVIPVLLMKSV